MTNPNRQDIATAHASLRELYRLAKATPMLFIKDFNKQNELLDDVLKVLPPNTVTTMADIEWDDNEHFMAEAEHPDHGTVIMLDTNKFNNISCVTCDDRMAFSADPQLLVPTGRRYILKENN